MTTFLELLRNIGWRRAVGALALAVLVSCPWWGPVLLSRLGYFHIRQVEIYGAVYASPSRIISRMRVDTTMSIWMNLAPVERRVARDPQVRSVAMERKLPGTLVVRLVENAPVALVESPGRPTKAGSGTAMRVVDGAGHALPIDPSRTDIDLPVVESADPSVLELLADVKAREPRLFAEISSVRRGSGAAGSGGGSADELDVVLPSVMVRALVGVSAERLADVIPVEADLARRHARVAELDLRFRDQVIARLQ